jgi:hypothetical protein
VYTARGLLPPTYTDGTLSAGVMIKAIHIDELRAAVMAVEWQIQVNERGRRCMED